MSLSIDKGKLVFCWLIPENSRLDLQKFIARAQKMLAQCVAGFVGITFEGSFHNFSMFGIVVSRLFQILDRESQIAVRLIGNNFIKIYQPFGTAGAH